MSAESESTLHRSLSLPLLTLYGLGTILGAGVYVLIGEVAGRAGMLAPLAFLFAALVAGLSAFSYAELSARYPQSAGEAAYTEAAFKRRSFATLVGYAVMLTGIVSAATLVNGFVGYLDVFVQLPSWLAIALLVSALTLLAAWGVDVSARAAVVITLIEVSGLIIVIIIAGPALTALPERWPELLPSGGTDWLAVAVGGFLAFYAFIGFEDMVNMAEEVRQPERTLPRAIFLALGISSVLYVIVALVAVMALPVNELANSSAPLADIVKHSSDVSPTFIAAISVLAVTNGALVQIIMAARVLYGMGNQALGPSWFACINPATKTPVRATLAVSILILVLALWLPLVTLAEITSSVILLIFTVVNVALWVLKRNGIATNDAAPDYPRWIPLCATVLCVGLLLMQLQQKLFA